MKTFFLAAAFIIAYLPLKTQNSQLNFGEIRLSDFEFQFQGDPDAEAIILYDKGHSTFLESNEGGFEIKFVRSKRIKINKKKGFNYADISIPYYVDGYGKTEKVSDIEAYVYNLENGSLRKEQLDKKSIFKEQINDNWYQYKFALANIQEGSIIEYRYTLNTPFLFKLPDWEFQSRIPTVYSRYTLQLIPFYEYVYLLQGITKFDDDDSKKQKRIKRRFAGVEYMKWNTIMC